MAKHIVPNVYIQEIDNTVRSTSVSRPGVGAIVMKSNKGPVNQRKLITSPSEFTETYGEPENLDDYGHFAAENFLAVSNQLYCVRATMGDEGYAQIQFPYTDSDVSDTYNDLNTSEFKFVNNEGDSNLKLINKLDSCTTVSSLTTNNEWLKGDDSLSSFYVYQKAQFATINDLITDNPASIAVYKNVGTEISPENIEKDTGKYVKFVSKISDEGQVIKWYDDLIFTSGAWTSGVITKDSFSKNNNPISVDDKYGYRMTFTIPSADTLNSTNLSLTAYFTKEFVDELYDESSSSSSGIKYQDLFKDENLYHGNNESTNFVEEKDAAKIQFRDWDDNLNKTYYVDVEEFEQSVGQAVGIEFREYGYNDNQQVLAAIADEKNELNESITVTTALMSQVPFETISRLADEYGCDSSEIATDDYTYLTYFDVWEGKDFLDETDTLRNTKIEKIIYTKNWKEFINKNNGEDYNEYLFWTVVEKDAKKATTLCTIVQDKPNSIVIPWQEGTTKEDGEAINKMTAMASSEILNGTNEVYRDGYTSRIESDDEPGNGDIEQYVSNKSNQLIIAATGPGEYGNDIGVSIITAECEQIPALNHQNAFMWKTRYDDEDLVEKDDPNIDYTWKKVYRINVYVKSKTQTADAVWGSGMDALLKDPVEWWLVSNDPTAKDDSGNSLYAPNVINGNSKYIYVSRNSVNEAKTGAGTYAQPRQTYSIYQLTGGSNSKKNNMTEKTAALKLYTDRQKADFDILFNVEAIETFNGKQRYTAHQKKIAEIASNRQKDIGLVQVTSKEAKTIKRQLSEAKMFSFNNPSYVAEYGGYDKYYNATLASWIYLPKSVAGACAIANCFVNYRPWYAPAGNARGRINYAVSQLTRFNDDELGQLMNVNVNVSRLCGAYGELLWCQKTALKLESALNRINVRCGLNYIEKQIEELLFPYIFEQNEVNTRSAIKNTLDAFFGRVKAEKGLYDYDLSIVQDDQDPRVVDININLFPVEALEFIEVKLNINRNGLTSRET